MTLWKWTKGNPNFVWRIREMRDGYVYVSLKGQREIVPIPADYFNQNFVKVDTAE